MSTETVLTDHRAGSAAGAGVTEPTRSRASRISERAFTLTTFLLIAVIPVENALAWGPVSLSRLVAALAAGLFTLTVLLGTPVVLNRRASAYVLAFAAWATLSYFWSYAPEDTLLYASTIVQVAVLVLLVWQACSTPRRLRLAFVSLAAGGTAGAAISLVDQVAAHGGTPRYSIGDPNDFGVFLSITLVATTHLALVSRGLRWKALCLLLASLQVLAILRTASRTAMIAAVAGLLVMLCNRSTMRPRVLAGLAGAGALVYLVGHRLVELTGLSRLESAASAIAAGDFNNRTAKWTLALDYWDASPVAGIGGGAFRVRSAADGAGTAVHSVWFGLLAELGLVGLVLFAALLVYAVTRVVRLADDDVRRVVLASWICWLVGTLTLTLEMRKFTWLLIALATCAGLAERARRPSP